jgi:formylglycine-generating enzyme required for sulfatase activity
MSSLVEARYPARWPYLQRLRWDASCALILDLILEALPLRDDLLALAELVLAQSGGRVLVCALGLGDGCWLREGKGPWRRGDMAQVQARRHWVMAGDLGLYARAQGPAWVQQMRIQRTRGGRVSLLVGSGGADWERALPPGTSLIPWDYGSPLHAAPLPGPEPAQVERLLAAWALAVRVEPPLLRALRLILGGSMADELAAWNHPDVERYHLAGQLRATRRAHYGELLRTWPQALRQQLVACIEAHHQGLSRLIQLEELALARDWGSLENDADACWQMALRTLQQTPHSAAARDLCAYLGRTGTRAHPTLWQAVPALEAAFLEARHTQLLAGQSLPAGISPSRLEAYAPDAGGAPQLLTLLRRGDALELCVGTPPPGGQLFWQASTRNGCVLQTPGQPRHWLNADPPRRVLGRLVPGQGPWYLSTSDVWVQIAEVARPSWAEEWGCDGKGVYALGPHPFHGRKKLYFQPYTDLLPGASGPCRFQAHELVEPVGLRHSTFVDASQPERSTSMHMEVVCSYRYGADAEFGLYLDLIIKNATQRLRWIPPGEFWMGSPADEPGRDDNEGPRHRVRLSRGYWLADTACSQAFWQAVMGGNPSEFTDDPQNPVEQVSWGDVQGFLDQLKTLLPESVVALPTEAEWEYACRAGTEMAFSWGNSITPEHANYDGSEVYTDGPKGVGRKKTIPVKSFPPNPWGLYQMHGNLDELCADGQREYRAEAQVDPRGPVVSDTENPVIRGGAWNGVPYWLRAAYRPVGHRGLSAHDQGFRFSLRPPSPEK